MAACSPIRRAGRSHEHHNGTGGLRHDLGREPLSAPTASPLATAREGRRAPGHRGPSHPACSRDPVGAGHRHRDRRDDRRRRHLRIEPGEAQRPVGEPRHQPADRPGGEERLRSGYEAPSRHDPEGRDARRRRERQRLRRPVRERLSQPSDGSIRDRRNHSAGGRPAAARHHRSETRGRIMAERSHREVPGRGAGCEGGRKTGSGLPRSTGVARRPILHRGRHSRGRPARARTGHVRPDRHPDRPRAVRLRRKPDHGLRTIIGCGRGLGAHPSRSHRQPADT